MTPRPVKKSAVVGKGWGAINKSEDVQVATEGNVGRFFCDIRGIIYAEYVPAIQTVTGQFYVSILERLRAHVFRVGPELVENGCIFHHDNTPTHSSFIVQEILAEKGISTLPHLPYSSDIAPCDSILFPKMKSHLKRNQYGGVQEVKEAVTMVLNGLISQD